MRLTAVIVTPILALGLAIPSGAGTVRPSRAGVTGEPVRTAVPDVTTDESMMGDPMMSGDEAMTGEMATRCHEIFNVPVSVETDAAP